jgi:hypothetical protein
MSQLLGNPTHGSLSPGEPKAFLNRPSEAVVSGPPSKVVLPDVKKQSGSTVIGFAATDYDDTAGGLDEASRNLTIVAATGITLGANPGES